MKHFPVNGADLAVVEEGSGPPLLLVHGFPLDHSMWQGQIAALGATCRVIAPDLRGFGQSSVTPGRSPCAKWPTTWRPCSPRGASAAPR